MAKLKTYHYILTTGAYSVAADNKKDADRAAKEALGVNFKNVKYVEIEK
jgi:hypothetical protein